jgi:hypothetical protein
MKRLWSLWAVRKRSQLKRGIGLELQSRISPKSGEDTSAKKMP